MFKFVHMYPLNFILMFVLTHTQTHTHTRTMSWSLYILMYFCETSIYFIVLHWGKSFEVTLANERDNYKFHTLFSRCIILTASIKI